MIRAWVAPIPGDLPIEKLTTQEREYCSRFMQPHDREARIAVRLFARAALEELGLPTSEIIHDDAGAPLYAEHPDLFLSLAHTNGALGVAISDSAIGIDIEDLHRKTDFELIAKRFFSSEERDQVLNPNPKRERFFELWTRKEAVLKAEKKGLSVPLRSVTFENDAAIGMPYALTTEITGRWIYSVAAASSCKIDNTLER